jgi:FKBP-type peptidyl-prolyl cis-trans isomerase
MRTLCLLALAFISAPAFAQTPPKTSVSVAPPDVKAPPADAIKSPSGLASKVIAPGTGRTHPGPTDIVTVQFTEWKADGSMVDSTQLRGKAPQFRVNRAIPGMAEGLALMVQGEKRRLWVPESLAFKGQREPKGMLVFDIELLSIMNLDAPADVKAAPADAKHTPSGLAYKVLTPGTGGRHPGPTSMVTVHYTGWSATDGKRFDSSVERGQPVTFALDEVIKGWTEGVQLMTEGEKTRFWIPDTLAYKGQPSRPQGMLVFDIELISIK